MHFSQFINQHKYTDTRDFQSTKMNESNNNKDRFSLEAQNAADITIIN